MNKGLTIYLLLVLVITGCNGYRKMLEDEKPCRMANPPKVKVNIKTQIEQKPILELPKTW